MADKAHVTSVEALQAFRTSLVLYLSKARPTLDEVGGDVVRTRLWLENDQRSYWEGQVRRRSRVLEQAQAALFGSRLSTFREASTAEQAAVNKARRALAEAEEKLRLVKRWYREFENRVEPLAKELGKLQSFLTDQMPKALAYLAQAVKTLEDYAQLAPSPPAEASGSSPSAASTDNSASSDAPAAAANPTGGETASRKGSP